MRKVYTALAGLTLLALVVQFYFAGVGAFDRPLDDGSFALHSITGMAVIPLLSILATIAAALARAPGRLIGLTIAPLGLVIVQALIVMVGKVLSDDTGATTPVSLAVLGLHALNGMATMGVAATAFRRARLFMAEGAATAAPAGAMPAR
ncbi:hypothetical protein Sru01_43480 [Sphaerisporangium rufum]|uniref:Uncharacterized protein n=1 Tax=Sphaerisporangium rufum TaxID=1381558 RepID=A0A919R6L7_9ACTN|nr:DUF6220 domain-containing protein [Sphaerisporangium rufum]GII79366.1 hypothetical protein Sru01_43480 [Sphaerisporangium rufum]